MRYLVGKWFYSCSNRLKVYLFGCSFTGNNFLCTSSLVQICIGASKPVNGNLHLTYQNHFAMTNFNDVNTWLWWFNISSAETGSSLKARDHRRWVLSVALGISCTFVVSVMFLVCWVYWYRSRLLFTSYGTSSTVCLFFLSHTWILDRCKKSQ